MLKAQRCVLWYALIHDPSTPIHPRSCVLACSFWRAKPYCVTLLPLSDLTFTSSLTLALPLVCLRGGGGGGGGDGTAAEGMAR
jgi:hypothetical protein